MHPRIKAIFFCISSITLTACSGFPGQVTKAYEAPLTFQSYQNPEAELHAQATALESMASDLVRRATLRGAATGAVLGCGAALISAGGVQKCATSAVVAGTTGGIMGYQKGKKQVANAMQATRMAELDQHLAGLRGQTSRFTGDLPAYLAAQDAELERLTSIDASPKAIAAKRAEIRKNRAALALALDETAANLARAQTTMADTSSRQSVDMQYQMDIAKQMKQEIYTAKSAISLI